VNAAGINSYVIKRVCVAGAQRSVYAQINDEQLNWKNLEK